MNGRTDGQGLSKRCVVASKKMEMNELDSRGQFWYERAHFVLPAKWSTLIEVMRDKGLGRKNQDILLRMHYGPERKKKTSNPYQLKEYNFNFQC